MKNPSSTFDSSTEEGVVKCGVCSLPEVPERTLENVVTTHHLHLIRELEKVWVNGTTLRYHYFRKGKHTGPDLQSQIAFVEKGFDVWRNAGIGISFVEVDSESEAEIRIGFVRNNITFSYVGREAIDTHIGQSQPTMNFGWDLSQDPLGVDTPVHEIGHALGFPHEHQSPNSQIVWDEEAVYEWFNKEQGWDEEKIYFNIIRRFNKSEVDGGPWDPHSIMNYTFGPGLIRSPKKYRDGLRPNGGLSPEDKRRVQRLYPPLGIAKLPQLKLRESRPLKLRPAQQANFDIRPMETREYNFGTFGDSDVIMVLFENQDDGLRFYAGNDNSGKTENAFLQARLFRGREYILRVRMYLNYGVSDSALMMW